MAGLRFSWDEMNRTPEVPQLRLGEAPQFCIGLDLDLSWRRREHKGRHLKTIHFRPAIQPAVRRARAEVAQSSFLLQAPLPRRSARLVGS
jgi:hypothetical protein